MNDLIQLSKELLIALTRYHRFFKLKEWNNCIDNEIVFYIIFVSRKMLILPFNTYIDYHKSMKTNFLNKTIYSKLLSFDVRKILFYYGNIIVWKIQN